HGREELRELCSCVRRTAASVLQFLKIGDEAIEITGCWANLYAPGAAHRAHSHPNNYLSAVYYVRTFPGADTINFHDPRSQTGVLRPPSRSSPTSTPIRSWSRSKTARCSSFLRICSTPSMPTPAARAA